MVYWSSVYHMFLTSIRNTQILLSTEVSLSSFQLTVQGQRVHLGVSYFQNNVKVYNTFIRITSLYNRKFSLLIKTETEVTERVLAPTPSLYLKCLDLTLIF